MTAALLFAGLTAIGLGGLLAVFRPGFSLGLWLQASGSVAVAVAGFWILGSDATLGDPFTSEFHLRVGVDGLSGFFLGMLGLVAAASLVFSIRYLTPTAAGRAIAALMAAFLLAMVEVVGRDPVTLLAGWELMTILPAAVILIARGTRIGRRDERCSCTPRSPTWRAWARGSQSCFWRTPGRSEVRRRSGRVRGYSS